MKNDLFYKSSMNNEETWSIKYDPGMQYLSNTDQLETIKNV